MGVHVDGERLASPPGPPGGVDVRHRLGVAHAAHVRRCRLGAGSHDRADSRLQKLAHWVGVFSYRWTKSVIGQQGYPQTKGYAGPDKRLIHRPSQDWTVDTEKCAGTKSETDTSWMRVT